MKRGKVYLLDANVLIALTTPDHTGHDRARAWFAQFATCPITQGALIRFYLRWAQGPTMEQAKRILSRIVGMSEHSFWQDEVSYIDVPGRGVTGHRQVTDAYLVALAAARRGLVATMDEALAAVHRDYCELI